MKFSAILGSLAIYGLQVHAIPTDLDPQAIQPIEASSPIPNTLEARDTYFKIRRMTSPASFPGDLEHIIGPSLTFATMMAAR
ncbi:hypothetical protein E4U28_004315 [Claviceps purpurea]|nr:hypothetical protein E4U28_004315 [Claviceps purpurea]